MKNYICEIYSNSSNGREYEVTTKSAMKCAAMHGRCEAGEVVTVKTQAGKILSRVMYTQQDGGRYYRVTI